MEPIFSHESIAICLIRVFTGMLFLMQGFDKIFRMGISNLIETIKAPFLNLGIPMITIRLFAFLTSFIELFAGLFLMFGLFKFVSLYALGIDLLIASFGMAIINPMWDMKHVFPRLILISFLLLYPSAKDILAFDHFIF